MVQVGQVVEFIDHNQFVLGVCLETKNDRPRILTQQNREMNLSSRRLVGLPGPTLPLNLPRTEIINRLKQLAEKRHELAQAVDLAELWSLLAEAAEEDLISPEFAAGLIFGGPIQSDQVSALLRAIIEDKIYFRFRGEGLEITPPDQLERLQAQKAKEEQLAREKEAVSAWLANAWTLTSPPPPTPPPTEKLIDQLIDVAVNGPDSPIFPVVKGYLESAGLTGARAAFDILVKLGIFTPDEDLEIRRCKLPVEFPAPVLQETAALTAQPKPESLPPSTWADRVDLTGEPIFTLDGPSTNDFDDALSVSPTDQGLTVSIHITDVGHELKPGTALDLEARARGASLYLPDKILPMLPTGLSEDRFSLKQDRLKPALSLKVEMDDQGRVLTSRLCKSLIRVRQRLVYQEVERDLGRYPDLLRLHDLALKLRRLREEEGALNLEVPEIIVFPTRDGIRLERIEQTSPSRLLVAELMILANRLVAETLAQAGIPTLFRSQGKPNNHFEPPPGADPLWATLRRRMCLCPVEIGPEPGPHSSLGLKAYTTFTSPIRRYLDLIAIRQIQGLFEGGGPAYDKAALEQINLTLAPTLRTHSQLKFRRQRYWLLKYLSLNKAKPLEAIVLDRLHERFSLVLLETMLRVVSPRLPANTLLPGSRIQVRIRSVDPQDDYISIELA